MDVNGFLKELDALGVSGVRLNLARGSYDDRKTRIAEHWLNNKSQIRLDKNTKYSQIATACAVAAALFTALCSAANVYLQHENMTLKCEAYNNTTPHPNPPPQGGREKGEALSNPLPLRERVGAPQARRVRGN
jgi:hypothetical protein